MLVLVCGCSSVATRYQVKENDWIVFNHKTKYAIENRSENEIYLTVIYSSYTYMDTSLQAVPLVRGVFKQISMEIAKKKTKDFSYDENTFYDSAGYSGLTGISETLVSNSIKFF